MCGEHAREALHDFTPSGETVDMYLSVTPDFITLTFANTVAYQVPNVHKKEGEEAAAEFMAGLADLGYEIQSPRRRW